ECTQNDQCESGFCVDGLCCELACDGQCQACDLPGFPGKCLSVGSPTDHADPHPNQGFTSPRSPCKGLVEGEKTGCTGYCDGHSASECPYPTQTSELKEPTCTDKEGGPSTFINYPCMGNGTGDSQTSDCPGGFKCADAHVCKTSCANDA